MSDNGIDELGDVTDDELAAVEPDDSLEALGEIEEGDDDELADDAAWPDAAKAAIAKAQAAIDKIRQSEQRTRERYQPFERAFSGLNDENAAALVGFAQHLAGGDRVAVVNWLAENAVGMAGDDLVDELRGYGFTKREAEKAVKQAEAGDGAAEALTSEQIRDQILEQVRKEAAEQAANVDYRQKVAAFTNQVEHELREMGYDPNTDDANDVVVEARRIREKGEDPGSMAELLAAAHKNLMKRATARVKAAAAAREGRAGPRPVPEGPAPVAGSTQSRVDRIAQKLENAGDR